MYRALPTAVAALLAISPAAVAQWAAINLNPQGWSNTSVGAVTPTRQFGSGVAPTPPYGVPYQALVWSGSPSSLGVMNLMPEHGGRINAAIEQAQVGISNGVASVWYNTPGSLVSLHPEGYWLSTALALTSTHQFGFTRLTINHQARAAMWSGTAASFIDMNPPNADSSAIRAAFGDRQGGAATYVSNEYLAHAGLWSGTPESFVEIHPGTAYGESVVIGMHGDQQVGSASPRYGQVVGWPHAALWHGTAESFVDLDPGAGYSALNATVGSAQVGYIAPPAASMQGSGTARPRASTTSLSTCPPATTPPARPASPPTASTTTWAATPPGRAPS